MKIRDRHLGKPVDVSDRDCPRRACYWPRPDPGVYTQGVGYRTRNPGKPAEWLCGTREARGCPDRDSPEARILEGAAMTPTQRHEAQGRAVAKPAEECSQ